MSRLLPPKGLLGLWALSRELLEKVYLATGLVVGMKEIEKVLAVSHTSFERRIFLLTGQ